MIRQRNIKDTVFTTLFESKEKILELYRALHPEDMAVSLDDIEILTIEHVLSEGLYNDLAFNVRGRKIVLVEAQSSYNPNMPLRLLTYYIEILKNLFYGGADGSNAKVNIYGSKAIELPSPEFYVVYTGTRDTIGTMSLKDLFVTPTDSELDLKVTILREGKSKGDIISHYIDFCNVANERRRANGRDYRKAAEETVDSCIQKGILKDFMIKRKKELVAMLSILFDEEYARTMREKALVEEAVEEAIEEEREKVPYILQGIRQGLTDEDINEKYGFKKETVRQIRAQMGSTLA